MANRNRAAFGIVLAALAIVDGGTPVTAQSATVAKSPAAAQQLTDRLRRHIDELRARPEGNRLPPADSFSVGPRQIAASATVTGPVAVAQGAVDVYGHVNGDVFVLDGDATIHRGAEVTGDVVAIGGRVSIDGGRVDGEIRMLSTPRGTAAGTSERPPLTTWESIKLVIGWFAVLVIIGLGVMMFAEPNMDGVVQTMERDFTRAFWFGLLGEVMALPALLLLCIGLVLTILGALLVPFAIVSYAIAVAGLLALGFLAVARLTGSIWSHPLNATPASARAANLRSLLIGVTVYVGLWLLAAVFTWQPVASAILRGVALAVSWVAVTVGLGAAMLSRGGTRHLGARPGATVVRPAPEDLAWQTPTPVTGVTAARRPQTSAVKDTV